ncbi:putative disease resistance protein RGA1 [Chenopodium quinoa]|uniref:NB-ARC domain-containing protein n=1 Tax=Chenopodium quinoa TaxID=63459 RepID=A0A803KUH0_CHEQI|nr:putative disease resistance protein RGA1 [Chenopodium quinoa]
MENDVIIGRDDDKRNLINMLLDTTVEENVSIVTVFGIGGLGKTTLVQLVYNDGRIREEFPLKMWVCVSDDFNVKLLAAQILAVATNQAGPTDGLTMDQLQKKLRQVLERNKFLLVLDDVWNENYEELHNIKTLLAGGGIGSRVLVTSRSKKVTDVVGSCKTQELKGLSDDESLALFQKTALKPKDYPMKPQLAIIGKEIVRKCANVPLAIRVVSSLLRGQGESKWENLKDTDLTNLIQDEFNGIVPVLKIIYNYLPFHLKQCFSYCDVFPKDYKIVKMDLIHLWMAQGFIMPSNGESFEDAGKDYFKQLLQRCFFQDVDLAEGTLDEAISCKMHDLVHDLAKDVAGTEILSCNYWRQNNAEKTHHVFLDRSTSKGLFSDNLIEMKRTRTFLIDEGYLPCTLFVLDVVDLFEKISKMKCLRALSYNANYLVTRTLLSAIGKLLHLRYLELSHNQYLLVFPSSITNIYNLQTLKLYWCQKLERLPMKLGKLVNLRHLDIYGCSILICMAPDMNRMTYLHNLTGFVVGGTSNVWCSGSTGELVNLEIFSMHSEILEISVQEGVRYNAVEAREQGFQSKSQRLREIKYYWRDDNGSDESDNAEALLQSLQPNSYLRRLELWNYSGVRLLIWMMNLKSCLPNLVVIQIRGCRRLEHLPWMSQLHHLKILILNDLHGVEYKEGNIISGDEDEELVFFPSLENLKLWHVPNLKGWWKLELGKGETSRVEMLSYLRIQD